VTFRQGRGSVADEPLLVTASLTPTTEADDGLVAPALCI